jgi:hypothetical protein
MKQKNGTLPAIIGAILFTILFYKQATGLNLVIFELIYLGWLLITRQISFGNLNMIITTAGLLITLLFTVITHSLFGYIIHYLALFVFTGMVIYPQAKSLINVSGLAFLNIGSSQRLFLLEISGLRLKGKNIGSLFRRGLIFFLPLVIILVFIVIYRNSNPWFDALIGNIFKKIGDWLEYIFRDFDFMILVTFIIGLLVCSYLLFRYKNNRIAEKDSSSADLLLRKKGKRYRRFKTISLKNEYRAGIFLLLVLNAIILVVNILDIYWVWFNFTWNGQYLKQFVHEGTYLLILSILISIVLTLYFFRRNINFYQRNKFLKALSYIWLAQNALLTISVGVRNFWYIYYYALAYRRIGVIIFLILTLVGLITVMAKVKERKTAFYLFRTNALALYIVLVLSSIINWDMLIAKYNFSHAERSFLHLNFMADLSDKALPYLDVPLAELKKLDTIQKQNFPYEKVRYMNPETYHSIIDTRKAFFKEKWENKGFLSWNLPEYLAYEKLYGKKGEIIE